MPVEFSAREARGDLCARMTLDTVSDRVAKRRTSPDCGAEDEAEAADEGGVDDDVLPAPALVRGEVGEGTGEGYARYEFSAEGDRAHIATQSKGYQHPFTKKKGKNAPSGFGLVSITCSSRILLMS